MARDESAPFQRGSTYYNGGTIDTTNLGGINLEGKEFTLEVNDADNYATGAQSDPSGRPVRVKVVRNSSTIPLLPKKLVVFDTTYTPTECRVNGYTDAVTDRPAGVVDEFLPAAGVPVNDLFYIVIDGPTVVQTVTASLGTVAVGTPIVPGTGTNRTSADAGRAQAQDLTGATATLGSNIQNKVGYSELATASTSVDLPIVVHRQGK